MLNRIKEIYFCSLSPNYKKDFLAAIKRNDRFGLSTPKIDCQGGILLNNSVISDIGSVFQKISESMTIEEVVCNCLGIHYQFADTLSSIVKAPALLTLGYVQTSKRNYYYQSEEDLKGMMDNGMKKESADIHAWLTLPTMEIVDFTFAASHAWVNGKRNGEAGIIASHPDRLKGGLRFHPMLVGDDFLWKSRAFQVQLASQ